MVEQRASASRWVLIYSNDAPASEPFHFAVVEYRLWMPELPRYSCEVTIGAAAVGRLIRRILVRELFVRA